MAIIGTFTAQTDGFGGPIRTLTLNVNVKFLPNTKGVENALDYRVMAGSPEIGAAWLKMSKGDRRYLSVSLDDPSFPATIYANWSRTERASINSSGRVAHPTKLPGGRPGLQAGTSLPAAFRRPPT